jgi:hypothetical protein
MAQPYPVRVLMNSGIIKNPKVAGTVVTIVALLVIAGSFTAIGRANAKQDAVRTSFEKRMTTIDQHPFAMHGKKHK